MNLLVENGKIIIDALTKVMDECKQIEEKTKTQVEELSKNIINGDSTKDLNVEECLFINAENKGIKSLSQLLKNDSPYDVLIFSGKNDYYYYYYYCYNRWFTAKELAMKIGCAKKVDRQKFELWHILDH